MGTNYYLWRGICECCGKPNEIIHIGKSSAGWKFLFRAYLPPHEVHSISSIEDWARETKIGKIYDEYDRTHSYENFWLLVEAKQTEGRSHIWNDQYRKAWLDEEEYNLADHEFS